MSLQDIDKKIQESIQEHFGEGSEPGARKNLEEYLRNGEEKKSEKAEFTIDDEQTMTEEKVKEKPELVKVEQIDL